MFSFAIKHISDETQYPNFVPSVAHGTSDGMIKPLVAHFDMRLPYVVDEENGTARKTMTGLFPSGKYSDLNYTPVFSPNRFLGWCSKPYDAEVEYLESTGTQYIDTGVVPAGKIVEHRIDVRFPDISTLVVASESVVNESTDNSRSITVYNGNFRWKYNYYAANFAVADTMRHVFVANGANGWLFDGGSTGGPTTQMVTPSTNTLSITCFASHQPWDTVCFRLAIYSYAIIVDGVIVRDFIPVRVGVEGCLYDKVTGTIFRNQGTGAFLYGDDIALAKSMDSSTKIFYDVPEVHAKWQPPAKITFNATANGGSMPSWEHFYYETLPYGILPSVNGRSHYYYEGWFTSASDGTKITTSAIVPASATLYAQWTAAATITFDATTNGGAMPGGWTAPDYYPGHPYGQLPTPTHPSLTFIGWYLGSFKVTESTLVVDNATLVAQYSASAYSVDISNGDWVLQEPNTNPDTDDYLGVYQSDRYHGAPPNDGCVVKMYINVVGYTNFTVYIRSNAEVGWSYTIALNPDVDPSIYDDAISNQMMATSSNSAVTDISGYTEVNYTLDGESHRICICYIHKDSYAQNEDRGYVLIPKIQ